MRRQLDLIYDLDGAIEVGVELEVITRAVNLDDVRVGPLYGRDDFSAIETIRMDVVFVGAVFDDERTA